MGFTAGLHTMDLAMGLAIVDGSQASRVEATAPLPFIGLMGAYQLTEKWLFFGRLDWLDVQVGDLRGIFTDLAVALEHQTFDRVSFGVGINSFVLDVSAEDSGLRGQLELGFDSLVFYVSGRFGGGPR